MEASPQSPHPPPAPSRAPARARYDRGVRVWGAHGQEALDSSSVALLGASAAGCEALKSLILGGIASFVIVDAGAVSAEDQACSFLLSSAPLGACRAQATARALEQLNEEVRGSFVSERPEILLAQNPAFFDSCSLVLASQLRESHAVALDAVCRARNVPLLLLHSRGLAGTLRLSMREHCVVEAKPDTAVEDLRLAMPWTQLTQAADNVDVAAIGDADFARVPYALLLVKAARAWLARHSALPKTFQEKQAFKDAVRELRPRKPGDPAALEEENVAEAVVNAHRVWAPPAMPSELLAIMEDEAATALRPKSEPFWICVAALRTFYEEHRVLPLQGSIPDMHSSSAAYLGLKRIYAAKADADAAQMLSLAQHLASQSGCPPGAVTHEYVRFFCRHARHIRVLRWRPVAESGPAAWSPALLPALEAEDSRRVDAAFYVALRAAERFLADCQRHPGDEECNLAEDVRVLASLVRSMLHEAGMVGVELPSGVVEEVARWGGGDLVTVSTALGAMACQEAIKILTRQFVPVQGTVLLNAVHASTSVLAL